jgi:hypothetical protein
MATKTDDAQAVFATMQQRHKDAVLATSTANAALAAARSARQSLMDTLASTGKGTVADMTSADNAIRAAEQEAELRKAYLSSAKLVLDKSQVALWQCQADDIKARMLGAIEQQIEAGKAVDEAVKAATAVIDSYNQAALAVSVLSTVAHHHDGMVESEGGSNGALGGHVSTWPRTKIKPLHQPQPVRLEMHQENRGWPVIVIPSTEKVALGAYGNLANKLAAA